MEFWIFLFLLQINVIPSYAEAFVNFRIHSAQTLQEVRGHAEATAMTHSVSLEAQLVPARVRWTINFCSSHLLNQFHMSYSE